MNRSFTILSFRPFKEIHEIIKTLSRVERLEVKEYFLFLGNEKDWPTSNA